MYRWMVVVMGFALFVPTASGKTDYVIVRDVSIGGFTRDGTVKEAFEVFGPPASRALRYELCQLTWPSHGLVMETYASQNSGIDPCGPNGKHKSTTVTDRRWRTSKGLAIGESLGELRKLYPKAQSEGAGRWRLLTRRLAGLPFTSLGATMRRGRVASFTVYGPRSPF